MLVPKSYNVNNIILGGIYQTKLDLSPIRILSFDQQEFFYDVWWNHLNDWGNRQSLNKKVYFFRSSRNQLENDVNFIRINTLTTEEEKVYRPDLPMRICFLLSKNLIFGHSKTFEEYQELFADDFNNTNPLKELNVPEIFMIAFDKKKNYKKSIKIKSMDGKSFSGIELLWNILQLEHLNKSEDSNMTLEIYRLGFERGIPSFFYNS